MRGEKRQRMRELVAEGCARRGVPYGRRAAVLLGDTATLLRVAPGGGQTLATTG